MKFMYHSASFGGFLFLLILASTNADDNDKVGALRQNQRGPMPTATEIGIVFYVLGTTNHTCTLLLDV